MGKQTRDLYLLVILLIFIIVYGLTLAPGLSWANEGADGGDLISAAAVGGVPHPTGYPLYLLLAAVFQKMPWGSLAFRTNLMSALIGVLACLGVYFLALRLRIGTQAGRGFAFVSSLAFGLSPLFWSQAVISEVHTLQAFLVALVLIQAFSLTGGWSFNILRGFLVGLALGNHPSSIFLIPVLLWEQDAVRIKSVSALVYRGLGLALGVLIYLTLPLRALSHPPVNWHNPVTVQAFFDLVSGRLYQNYFTTEFALDRVRGWAGILIAQFTFLGVLVGIAGFVDWHELRKTLPLPWLFITHGLLSLFYSPRDSYLYLIEALMVFALWIGVGSYWLSSIIKPAYLRLSTLVIPLVVVLILFNAWLTYPRVDASTDSRAEDFGQAVIQTVPRDAMVFSQDDRTSFALWYFHYALKLRPDIVVLVEDLLPYEWYRQNIRSTYPGLKMPETSFFHPNDFSTANPGLPICNVSVQETANIHCSP